MKQLVIACSAVPCVVIAIAAGAWQSHEPIAPAIIVPEPVSLKADRLGLAPVAAIDNRWRAPEFSALVHNVIAADTAPPKVTRPRADPVCAKGKRWTTRKNGYRYWRCIR